MLLQCLFPPDGRRCKRAVWREESLLALRRVSGCARRLSTCAGPRARHRRRPHAQVKSLCHNSINRILCIRKTQCQKCFAYIPTDILICVMLSRIMNFYRFSGDRNITIQSTAKYTAITAASFDMKLGHSEMAVPLTPLKPHSFFSVGCPTGVSTPDSAAEVNLALFK